MPSAARSLLTLRFHDPELERQFLQFNAELIALHQRLAAVIGIAIFSAGTLWIDWLSPGLHHDGRRLIFGFAVPVLALTFLLSFVKLSDFLRQVINCLDFSAASGVVIGLLRATPGHTAGAVAATPQDIFQVAGLPALFLIVIVTVTYVRFRFHWAFLFTPMLVGTYWLVAEQVEVSLTVRIANTISLVSITLLGSSLAYLIESYTRQTWAQQLEVERERRRSDELLHNILPSSIIERLRAGEERIADRYAQATVVFADLVGFTTLADGREPQEVVSLIAALVDEFDRIADLWGLEKIKTVGDSFMAVAGAPQPCEDHADRVLGAAADMLLITGEVSTRLGHPLELRIGVDSGPLIAGIIGQRKLAYDLWGDTVNTASRMESHGVVGAVQITEGTRALLRRDYDLISREVDIKGKGMMQTWIWQPPATK